MNETTKAIEFLSMSIEVISDGLYAAGDGVDFGLLRPSLDEAMTKSRVMIDSALMEQPSDTWKTSYTIRLRPGVDMDSFDKVRMEFASSDDAREHRERYSTGGVVLGRYLYPGSWTPSAVMLDCPEVGGAE